MISTPLAVSCTDLANSAALCSLNFRTEKQMYTAYVIIRGVHLSHCFLCETKLSFYSKIEIWQWCTHYIKTEKNKKKLSWLLDVHPIRVVGTRIQVGLRLDCWHY